MSDAITKTTPVNALPSGADMALISLGLDWLRGKVGSCDPKRLSAAADATARLLGDVERLRKRLAESIRVRRLAEWRAQAAEAERARLAERVAVLEVKDDAFSIAHGALLCLSSVIEKRWADYARRAADDCAEMIVEAEARAALNPERDTTEAGR